MEDHSTLINVQDLINIIDIFYEIHDDYGLKLSGVWWRRIQCVLKFAIKVYRLNNLQYNIYWYTHSKFICIVKCLQQSNTLQGFVCLQLFVLNACHPVQIEFKFWMNLEYKISLFALYIIYLLH